MHLDRAKFLAACRKIDRPQAWVGYQAGLKSRQAMQNYLNGRQIEARLALRFVAILGETDILADDLASTPEPMSRSADPDTREAAQAA